MTIVVASIPFHDLQIYLATVKSAPKPIELINK